MFLIWLVPIIKTFYPFLNEFLIENGNGEYGGGIKTGKHKKNYFK